MRCDLHAHSTISDGTLRPADVVAHASRVGVGILALTDHDDVRGLPEAAEAARRHGIELVCGIELSVSEEDGKRQLHVLGLGIEPEQDSLVGLGDRLHLTRRDRAQRIVDALAAAGVELTFEDVLEVAGDASLGRPHIARALVACGAARDLEEAFARFLRKGRPGFVPRSGLSSREAIEAIHAAGGVAVLAHPARSIGVDGPGGLAAFVARLVPLGIDGLEADHPSQQKRTRTRIRRLAREHELVVTGGSDFHGESKPGIELGSGRNGNVKLNHRVYEAVMDRRDRIRN